MEKLYHTLVSFRSRTGPAAAGGAMAGGENGVERAGLGCGVMPRLVQSRFMRAWTRWRIRHCAPLKMDEEG